MFCFVFLSMRKNLLFFSASPNGGFKCDAPTEYRVALIDYYKEGVKDSPIKMKNFRAKCCKTTKQLSLHHLVVTSNIASHAIEQVYLMYASHSFIYDVEIEGYIDK